MNSDRHPAREEKITHFIEIRLVISRGIEDQMASFLTDLGSEGVWLEPAGEASSVIGYLPAGPNTQILKESILHYLRELRDLGFKVGPGRVDLRAIPRKDWAEEWKKSYDPLFVTEDIVVVPEWGRPESPGKIVIRVKPGIAFGTGDHATTQLCIRALAKLIKPGDRTIDVGCGSGILSIVSVKLGGSYALGLDIDQDAMPNAEENLALNGVEDAVEVRLGTANAGIPGASFDVAVVNINRIEIVESYDKIELLVKAGGNLIFSGILDGEKGYMSDFFKRQKLKDVEVTRQEEWVCFVGRK